MFYIEDADAVQVMPIRTPASTLVRHFFQAGNTRTGTPATVVTDDFLNIVMNELCNVVEAAGLTLDKMDDTQLLQAIRQIAGSGKSLGIPLWSAADCYSPLPHIVWDDDQMLYVATAPSGPCVAAGAKKPTTSPEYWMSMPDWLMQFITIPDAEMGIPKWVGGKVWTHPQIVWDEDSDGWDLWISLQTSGTTAIGDKRPTTTTGYWMRLSEWVKTKITPKAAQTFYVRTDGNDDNSGLNNSASGAFRTITGALNKIQQRQYVSPFPITIKIGSGTFNEAVLIPAAALTSDSLNIEGAGSASTIISATNANPIEPISGKINISKFSASGRFTNTSIYYGVIMVGTNADLTIGGDISLNSDASTSALCAGLMVNGLVTFYGTTTISGTVHSVIWIGKGEAHIGRDNGAAASIRYSGLTAEFGAMSTYGALLHWWPGGSVTSSNSSIKYAFMVRWAGIIQANGAGANWLPGTNAGIVELETFGLYIP